MFYGPEGKILDTKGMTSGKLFVAVQFLSRSGIKTGDVSHSAGDAHVGALHALFPIQALLW